jgi:hypothetical protein
LFAKDAGDAVSAYWVGRALVEAGDEHGLTLLERSVELDQHSTQAAADVAVPFLVDHYRFEDADAWSARALEYVVRAAEAERERSRLRSTDEVEPHGLPDDAVESLRAAVAGVKGVKRAYLVRKRCTEFPDDEPVWILGLKPRPKHFRYERRSRNAALVKAVSERVQPSFEGLLWIAPLAGGLATLEAAMAATPGALLLGKRSRTARAYAPIGWRGGFAAAVVIVGGFFGIMWLVTSRSGPPPPGYGASPAPEVVTPGPTSRWGRAATMRCARAQTAYTASVGRGAPMLDARLRLERDFLTVLATTPGAPAGRDAAVRLARKRVALFARAIGLKKAGDTAKAQAFFERYAATSARRAVAALDAPSCAT